MDSVKLIAPSSAIVNLKKSDLEVLDHQLNQLNLKLNYTKYIFEKKSFFAGTDKVRLRDLTAAFNSTQDKVIFALRGGEGCMRLLDKLDYKMIKKHPKVLFGFSDTTALQNAIWTKTKIPSYSGFLGCYGFKKIAPKLKKNLKNCLENIPQSFPVTPLKQGKATGILLGGNLSVFTSLLGTPYFPDLSGKILVLEEVNEAPYRLDRLLTQLKLSGVFGKISGLILGDMTAGLSPKDKKVTQELIQELIKPLPYPVVQLKGYSHHNGSIVLPIGGVVHINTQKKILTLDKLNILK